MRAGSCHLVRDRRNLSPNRLSLRDELFVCAAGEQPVHDGPHVADHLIEIFEDAQSHESEERQNERDPPRRTMSASAIQVSG